MAVYKASPFYSVGSDQKIVFDHAGMYKTNVESEIKQLNALCPRWISCIESDEEKENPGEPKPAPKKQPRKSSAK
ncbi:hypothetical protein [Bacillus subtilis]